MLAWLLVFHLLGIVMWVAGVFGAGRVMIDHARGGGGAAFTALERQLLFKSGHAGMTLAILTGAAALTVNPSYYLGEAWMWAKLGAAAMAVASTIVLTVCSKRLATTPPTVGEKAVKLWRGLFMGSIAAALVFVFVKPL